MDNSPIFKAIGDQEEIRVRFAPSPTGYLHLGGARTALYNWLLARKYQGTFVLRIEDTDRERSEDRFLEHILQDLRWLGLSWDEGPYFQSERTGLYRQYAQALIEDRKAYYCFCSPEELEQKRRECTQGNTSFRYGGTCRSIPLQEAVQRVEAGESASIRFRTPEDGRTELQDLIRRRVSFENREIDDFIIVRSNGEPTYNLTVVVDDALMKITHVIRGDDHLSNTPKQVLLYHALHFPCPRFAHIPLIMGPDNTRLSKRHGATAVNQYREQGYLPEALINYLALLGWSYDDQQTLFSIPELIDKFDLGKVSKKAAVFDPKKLDWMNGKYIRQLPDSEYISLALSTIYRAGLIDENTLQNPSSVTTRILQTVRERVKKLSDLPVLAEFFFKESITLTDEARDLILAGRDSFPLLKELYASLREMDIFDEEALEKLFRDITQKQGMRLGDLVHPVRAAISGKTSSPGIFLTMVLLGKERVLQRLGHVLQNLENQFGSPDISQGARLREEKADEPGR
jgi:glutamyl-tRNA synthetase